ncbi:MAG: PEP-CTERM sorting domain-containing protein [Fimbriimonadaceae bacterium]|nr:PEP-CTERM sorting domain-containing protein [Fimbriimonadaceae bacterium]
MKLIPIALVAVGASMATSASAIIWRNDIPQSTVLTFGNDARFQGVGRVTVGGGSGTGTFLGIGTGGQAWGISAKHVITTGNTGSFTFEDGGNYAITQAIGFAGADVSIFKISGWNRNVFTPGLHSAGTYAAGTNLDSAGYGLYGAEGGSPWQWDNKRRGMQTKLVNTQMMNFGGENQLMLIDRFDSPNDPNVRPVEGFGAPGDSGSMLLDGSGLIWGVLSGGQFEQYGALNWYATITPQLAQQIYTTTGIPVPEPATLIVLGLGALALRRRKNKKA